MQRIISIKRSVLDHFGIDKLGYYSSHIAERFKRDIKDAIMNNQMAAISGEAGNGKSWLFEAAQTELSADPDSKPFFISIIDFAREKLSIAGILHQVISALSTEPVKLDRGARSIQAIRLIGERFVAQKQHVCLIIEEAHRLNLNILRSLKEMREQTFAGKSPLFSVILIGHPELMVKLQMRNEVYWRTISIPLIESEGWMTYEERLRYLKMVFGEAIASGARERIAAICRQPLEMDVFVGKRLEEAKDAGYSRLEADCIDLSPRELAAALKVSYREIAEEAGLGKSTVHDVLHGMGSSDSSRRVKDALERLASQKGKVLKEAI